jgi:hypothetical protein
MVFFPFRSSANLYRQDNPLPVKAARARSRNHSSRGVRLLPSLCALEERALLSTVTVTNTNDSGPGSLRDAINNAVSGEVINFAKSAYGTINLTSGPLAINFINLTIQGPGPNKLTISGGGNFTDIQFLSTFPPTDPPPPGFTPNSLSISGVTIANGNASGGFGSFGDGGAIDSNGALTLSSDVVANNQAPDGIGGAIYSCCGTDSMNINQVVFSGNSAGSAADNPGFQLGGAIFNVDGVANITASTFVNNQAIGSNAQGGAIQTSYGSTLNITGSTFVNNQALGSQSAAGGAIFGDPAVINVNSSTFTNNLAQGDSSQTTSGGAIVMTAENFNNVLVPVTETVTNSTFTGNQAVGLPGSGASVQGGAISSQMGTLVLTGSTFIGNQAVAGSSTTNLGGVTSGGAVFTESEILQATSDTFLNNTAVGGSSPMGVLFANGGAIEMFFSNFMEPNAVSTIANSLFSGNRVLSGAGGGFGSTGGGAVASLVSPVAVSNTAFLDNQAVGSQGSTGVAGTEADGGAVFNSGSVMTIQGGLIVGNSAIGGNGGGAPGGNGGAGGAGGGGGIADVSGGALTISGTTIAANSAIGGAGGGGSTPGTGGNGMGGGILVYPVSTLTVTGGTVLGNLAQGGSGGGDGFGGGVFTIGTTTITDTLITLNDASGGSGGGEGIGGGLYIYAGFGMTTLTGKTKVIGNFASTSSNDIYGTYGT